jgi:LuxR family maltose regulon positive regulatory protein
LIAAPAGFGKTTLIGDWISSCERPISWLTVDDSCNNFATFFNYLIASLGQVDERLGQSSLPLVQSKQYTDEQDLITSLINDLSESDIRQIFVLDDYHRITSFSVHDALSFLIDNQPPNFHMVIGTREDPPLPLARLRARGQITEIRERTLRFTSEETTAFLNTTMKLNLGAENIEALDKRTEGWITGLQLAGLALRNEDDPSGFVAAFAGNERFIMDYLLTEVIEGESDRVRSFLRDTSILERLSAPLCNALTGHLDGQEILDHLERANLFVIPLDRNREWFRYHQLFAEVLRLSLSEHELLDRHSRALAWYETHEDVDQAVIHALAIADVSGSLDEAERLIGEVALERIFSESLLNIRSWLKYLPDERVQRNFKLALSMSWVLTLSGDVRTAEEYLEAAERLQEVTAGSSHGLTLVLRCFITLLAYKEYDNAITMAVEALTLLSEEDAVWRVIALWARAEAEERTKPIPTAIHSFSTAREVGKTLEDNSFNVTVDMALAAALNAYGKRDQALMVCNEGITRYKDKFGRESRQSAVLFSQIGRLYHEANQLEQARQFLEKGLANVRQLGEAGYLIPCQSFYGLTLAASGEVGRAIELLESARSLAERTGLSDPEWQLAQIANIRFSQGDLNSAVRWSERTGLQPDDKLEFLNIEMYIIFSRILIKQDRLEEVRRLLVNLENFARERELHRYSLTIHILLAILARRTGDKNATEDRLTRAVAIAAPEEYYRAFIDEDLETGDLSSVVRQVNPRFVDQLISYMRIPTPPAAKNTLPLIEPLSDRELEVLTLINQGYSNAEIAQQLFIAIGTVKRHINNIYGKLDVKSRTQAIVKARELRLLD